MHAYVLTYIHISVLFAEAMADPLPKGSALFYEGESSFDLFLVLDGQASILSAGFRILEPFDAEDTRLQTRP